MKSFFLYIIILISVRANSQEPPANIIFNYTDIASDTTHLFKNYEIRTYCYRESIENVKNRHLDLKQYAQEKNGEIEIEKRYEYSLDYYGVDGDLISVWIDGYIPNNGDVVLLSLRKIQSNEYLNIYIRILNGMDYGESLLIEKIDFQEGNYFFDACKSKKRYEANYSSDPYAINTNQNRSFWIVRYKFILGQMKTHSISTKKINRLRNKYKCSS